LRANGVSTRSEAEGRGFVNKPRPSLFSSALSPRSNGKSQRSLSDCGSEGLYSDQAEIDPAKSIQLLRLLIEIGVELDILNFKMQWNGDGEGASFAEFAHE
jgi:hypothetical protein